MLAPKLFTTLRSYTLRQLAHDVLAGVIVGIVAIPLAIAFAIASGVSPSQGLWTAIIAGFLISALGGSRVQIGGPTGAFVVIVYGIVAAHGIDGLMAATLMAGVLLIAMGLAGLGDLIEFVPHPVVTGFTSAIGVTILVQQLDSAFGLAQAKYPPHAVDRLVAYWQHAGTITPSAVGICAATLAILLLWPKVSVRIPAPFVALIIATVASHFWRLPVTTVGDRFGHLASSLPPIRFPHLGLEEIRQLAIPACTIAGLGAIESLLSAVVADGMIGGRHRSNMELVAQGVANIASPLFGGIPATGAIARTATNVKSGGRTPVAGMVHAITVLAITLAFGSMAELIPLAALAGILLLVSYRMIEWRVFRAELRGSRSDAAVLLTVFTLTLLVDLTAGIGVGIVLACLLFVRRMARTTEVRALTLDDDEMGSDDLVPAESIPPGVQIYEIAGPFFFGAANQFKDALAAVAVKPRVLIVRMRHVPFIDSTGLSVLRDLVRRTQHDGTTVMIAEVQEQPRQSLVRGGIVDLVGSDHVVGSLDFALALSGLAADPARWPSRHQ